MEIGVRIEHRLHLFQLPNRLIPRLEVIGSDRRFVGVERGRRSIENFRLRNSRVQLLDRVNLSLSVGRVLNTIENITVVDNRTPVFRETSLCALIGLILNSIRGQTFRRRIGADHLILTKRPADGRRDAGDRCAASDHCASSNERSDSFGLLGRAMFVRETSCARTSDTETFHEGPAADTTIAQGTSTVITHRRPISRAVVGFTLSRQVIF
ncbi:hypothetical protein DJ84_21695 [Halorubrum ezzemoulense]|nr:hypothetical protein DJ84_21695 [Halorubrum ezzemoulense]